MFTYFITYIKESCKMFSVILEAINFVVALWWSVGVSVMMSDPNNRYGENPIFSNQPTKQNLWDQEGKNSIIITVDIEN